MVLQKNSPDQNNTYTYLPNSLPYECIYDTGGFDVLDFSALEDGSTLKLNGRRAFNYWTRFT